MKIHPLLCKIRHTLSELYRHHGLKFPLVILHRAIIYVVRKGFGARVFELAGIKYHYEIHPYILDNERAVEIGLARSFLRNRSGDTLEVGNVLSTYMVFSHDVVDKYEQGAGVLNEDVVTYSPEKKYDTIITLSTLEHVGWDEQPEDPAKVSVAIERLKKLLKPDGRMLVTMPLGYNPHVDQMIREQRLALTELRFLKRKSADNQWCEATWDEVKDVKYGSPFACGNAIVVGYQLSGTN
jgi:SAM-dependent methyltransferase